MRGDFDTIRLGGSRDLFQFRDAAHMKHVRLNDRGSLYIQQLAKLPPGKKPFAGRNWYGASGRNVAKPCRVLAERRLLQEKDSIWLESFGELNCRANAES